MLCSRCQIIGCVNAITCPGKLYYIVLSPCQFNKETFFPKCIVSCLVKERLQRLNIKTSVLKVKVFVKRGQNEDTDKMFLTFFLAWQETWFPLCQTTRLDQHRRKYHRWYIESHLENKIICSNSFHCIFSI